MLRVGLMFSVLTEKTKQHKEISGGDKNISYLYGGWGVMDLPMYISVITH